MKLFNKKIRKIQQIVLKETFNTFNIINMGTGIFLFNLYNQYYEKVIASKLSAAVTNELFGHNPSNEAGIKFKKENIELINKKFSEVKYNKKLCYYISIASHLKANYLANTNNMTGDILLWIIKIKDAGILIPMENIEMPNSIDELKKITNEFSIFVEQVK